MAKLVWEEIKNGAGKRAMMITLAGPLGAGKTRFAKGIAQALDINPDQIISPTYVLETEYSISNQNIKLIHIDAYRMESADELIRLGIEKRIKHKDIIVIEWADKFRGQISMLNAQCSIIWVKIALGEKENERVIEMIIYN